MKGDFLASELHPGLNPPPFLFFFPSPFTFFPLFSLRDLVIGERKTPSAPSRLSPLFFSFPPFSLCRGAWSVQLVCWKRKLEVPPSVIESSSYFLSFFLPPFLLPPSTFGCIEEGNRSRIPATGKASILFLYLFSPFSPLPHFFPWSMPHRWYWKKILIILALVCLLISLLLFSPPLYSSLTVSW